MIEFTYFEKRSKTIVRMSIWGYTVNSFGRGAMALIRRFFGIYQFNMFVVHAANKRTVSKPSERMNLIIKSRLV